MKTQSEIAVHLDLSQQSVSEWMQRLSVDWRVASLHEIRVAYIRALREQAAGRAAEGGLDLAAERARLAKEQADKFAMQNAATRGELAPVVLIAEVLTKTASKITGIFDAIPGNIHRRFPAIPSEVIALIAGEIIKVRNVVAAMSLNDVMDEDAETNSGADDCCPTEK